MTTPALAARLAAWLGAIALAAAVPLVPSPVLPAAQAAPAAVGAADGGADGADGADGAVTIDLLGITDLHGHLSATAEDPGAVTLACEVARVRRDNPATLLVSAGDSIGASAYVSSVLSDQPTIDVLGAIGLDASALGNHELDQGLADLENRVLPSSAFPVLAANVTGSAALDAQGAGGGAVIKEVDGVRVGLVGAVTDELPTLVSPSSLSALTLTPAVEAANARASQLKDGQEANGEADVVVVLMHEDAAATASAFNQDVDVVFAGHTHVPFAQVVTGAQGNQVAVVQADHYGWALGRVSLRYDRAAGQTSVTTVASDDLRGSGCTTDAYGVAAIVAQAEADAATEGGRPLALIGSDFLRASDGTAPGGHRGTESTASNLIAESFRHWLAGDIQPTDSARYVGLMNAGGVRADYLYASSAAGEGDGVLTSGEAYTVQPFGNEMGYTSLTGAELKALLAQQWQPGASRSVLTLGLSANVDVLLDPGAQAELAAIQADLAASGQDASTRSADIEAARARVVRRVAVDGRALADTDTVVVASNSFVMAGGDGYTLLADRPFVNTGVLDRDVTATYLGSFGQDPVTAGYSKRQVGAAASYSDGRLTVTLDGLAYTPAPEQDLGARQVRVTASGGEPETRDIDLTVDTTGPTTGRASVGLAPVQGAAGTCHELAAQACYQVRAESLDGSGTVLNSVEIEVAVQGGGDGGSLDGGPGDGGPGGGSDGAESWEAGRDGASAPGQPGAGATTRLTATAVSSADAAQTASTRHGGARRSLARTGAAAGVAVLTGVLAVVLVVAGGLLVRRRRA